MARRFKQLSGIQAAVLAAALAMPTQGFAARKKRAVVTQKPVAPAVIPALPSGDLPLAATGALALDAATGAILYQRNADQNFYPASATKILTALLVIEEGNLDRLVTIELTDTKVEPSSIGFKPGEQYTRRQLLYALLLKSANDVAMALARDNAGSVQAFAAKMNRRASALGANSSHFVNPHGLHHPAHFTTPHDLALIARTAMEQPYFRRVVSTVNYPWTTATGAMQLQNHNKLLTRFPGCTGLKTGFTNPAQQVLVSSALWQCREIISVVMHTNKPGIWEDSKLLLTYGFANLPELPGWRRL